MLLRAGASLDSFRNDRTIEFVMQAKETYEPRLLEYDHWLETKALIAGVRKHGTYKRYMRAPHREFLALRGLAQRGKLAVQLEITARAARENPALNFIARLGDNGVCWHILSFWRATN